mmetsp:Transcript_24195/g.51298  ORF Transcript_24195/g.51298 Transcript_24195/m.51298 type:complete len:449 (-) Transcript_24195:284-1630(-)
MAATTRPRPITGSIGGRIRLIFGDNGNEWLMLLNNDNGQVKWQTKDWKGIPSKVATQLNNCTAKDRDVKAVDFGPDGAWFINGVKPDGTGGHSWWGGTSAEDVIKQWTSTPHHVQASFGTDSFGIKTYAIIQENNGYSLSNNLHTDLADKVKEVYDRKKTINFVRLFDGGKFFMSHSNGTHYLTHNEHIDGELRKPGAVEEIAIAGDGSWVVIRKDRYVSSTGVDEALTKKLSDFYSKQRRWCNERRREIQEAETAARQQREREEREAQEAAELAERMAREAAERAERMANEAREAAERADRERVQREAREAERAERLRIEQDAREAAEANAAIRISALEAKLEQRLKEEAKEIKELKAILQKKEQSFRDTMQSLPSDAQSRICPGGDNEAVATTNQHLCVVCQDEPATIAVVPCGHYCLCNSCLGPCHVCPICRGRKDSILRIYSGG